MCRKFLILAFIASLLCDRHDVKADTKTEQLEKRIERLEKGYNGGQRYIYTASKHEVSLSGQVNRAMQYADNGRRSRLTNIDNTNSNSAVALNAKADVDGLTIGAVFELYFAPNDADSGREDGRFPLSNNDAGNYLDIAQVDGYIKTNFGKLSLGRGYMASASTSLEDLSDTDMAIAGPSTACIGGAVTATNGVSINTLWDSYDTFSYQNRVRYDTPEIAGFMASVSHATLERSDIALRFAGKFNAFEISAAAAGLNSGHSANDPTSTTPKLGHFRQGNISASVLHDSGLNLSLASAVRHFRQAEVGDTLTKNQWMGNVKLGYKYKLLDCGQTAIAGNYGHRRHILQNKDRIHNYGFILVQNIEWTATDLYLTGQWFDYQYRDGKTPDPKTVFIGLAGARIKF